MVADALVRAAFGTVAALRNARAVHPRGESVAGVVKRNGLRDPVGVPWIDEPGEDRVTVRFSRAVGLPPPLPDFLGLAIRLTDPLRDLLLTTAGGPPVLRHLLQPGRDPRRATYTSVVAFRTVTGRLMVGAFPDPLGFELRVARPGTGWRPFATLTVNDDTHEEDVTTDPVVHPIEGLEMPAWLARPRAVAYDASRRARR